MALAYHAIVRSEEEIYSGCQTEPDGTLPSAAARYVQSLGLEAATLRLTGVEALQEQMVIQEAVPIVFVNLAPLLGLNVIHAVIIEAIDVVAQNIHVIDPAFPPMGHREWKLDLFEVGWRSVRYQTIMILPKS
jgi:hypothetical protein